MAKPKNSSSSNKPTEKAGTKATATPEKPQTASKADTPKTPVKKSTSASAKAATDKSLSEAAKTEPAKTAMPKVSKPPAEDKKTSVEPEKDTTAAKEAAKPAETSKVKTEAKADEKPVVSKPPVPTPTPEPQKQRSVFVPLVLGGVIAAGIGFAVSEFDLLGLRQDGGDVQAQLAAQQDAVDANEARLATLESATAPEVDLSGVEGQLSGLSDQVTALQARLDVLENRPVVAEVDPTAAQNYADELARLQTSVEDQKAEIQSLLENARSVEEATADMAQDAEQTAAMTAISAALTNGTPFADALADLQAAGVDDIPEGLSAAAEDGVATLLSLQTGFAGGARTALAAARDSGVQDGEDGLGGFLRRQLGARSVAPREGNDPDAVLSRAEAAVRAGTLSDALTEIDALPEDVQAGLEPWLSDARARAAAEAAIADISQRQTTN